jgi:hypothetical protein
MDTVRLTSKGNIHPVVDDQGDFLGTQNPNRFLPDVQEFPAGPTLSAKLYERDAASNRLRYQIQDILSRGRFRISHETQPPVDRLIPQGMSLSFIPNMPSHHWTSQIFSGKCRLIRS